MNFVAPFSLNDLREVLLAQFAMYFRFFVCLFFYEVFHSGLPWHSAIHIHGVHVRMFSLGMSEGNTCTATIQLKQDLVLCHACF